MVWLPLHRVTRERLLLVLQFEHVLEDIDQDLFASEIPLAVEPTRCATSLLMS